MQASQTNWESPENEKRSVDQQSQERTVTTETISTGSGKDKRDASK